MGKIKSFLYSLDKVGVRGTFFYWYKKRYNNDNYEGIYYRYIDRVYGSIIDGAVPSLGLAEGKQERIIWTCWLQGIDNAPALVKKCRRQLDKYASGYKIIDLDYDKIFEYISLPQYVIEKYKRGMIPNAHFCDIVRLALLEKYGGIWIDATVLLTEEIDIEMLERESIFCFKVSHMNRQYIQASSWFISAKKNNEIIVKALAGLLEYWKRNKKLDEYFALHYFFARAIKSSDSTEGMWGKVPYYNNVNCHILQHEFQDSYSEKRWDYIKKVSGVHKLTYFEDIDENSFGYYVINSEEL